MFRYDSSPAQNLCIDPRTLFLATRIYHAGSSTRCGLAEVSYSKLVARGKSGSWLTLSYCWGTGSRLKPKTLMANLERNCAGFRLWDLPPTFYDAVLITGEFGFRYLRIHSLCIKEDPHDDWLGESFLMAEIYSKAISADASTDAYSGIFIRANGEGMDPTPQP
ncbi:hypothetical protein BKA61DRAFT_164900 [Leptodontidium sp. MPI-SDFR-AT-0119]|nr:hypothetical protein BKA61DRAFT_164900 [Leptodontidium sp. MPI-SDFR-AT-0119]